MFKDFFIYSAEALAIGASTTVVVNTNLSEDADFEIVKQVASAISRNGRVDLFESSSGRKFNDRPVALAAWFGDGRRPFVLPVTKRLPGPCVLTSTITDESAAPNQVRLAFIGAKLFARPPFPLPNYVAREAYTYTAPFVAVAVDPQGAGVIPAGGILPYAIRIQDDADFQIRALTIAYDIAIPAASDCVATVMIKDENTQRNLMDRPIPVESLGASRIADAQPSGFFPFLLPTPKLLQHGSVLTVTVANQDAANALSIRISVHGTKLYAARPIRA